MGSILENTDAQNKLEDHSGVKLKPGENPYNALINACNDDHVIFNPFLRHVSWRCFHGAQQPDIPDRNSWAWGEF